MIILGINFGYSQNKSDSLKTYEFTVEGMTCGSCANTATNVLKNVKGVKAATVDFETKKAKVIASNKLSEKQIKDAIKAKTNFEAMFTGDELVKPLTEEEKKKADIEIIKGGSKLNFKDHLTVGKITVFDFYADWCGPCRVYSPKAEHLALKYQNVALKKADIVDWKSELSQQLTKDYKMPALPFTLIFNENGNLLSKIEGNKIEEVELIIIQNTK
jgi:copper chaperone CopZ